MEGEFRARIDDDVWIEGVIGPDWRLRDVRRIRRPRQSGGHRTTAIADEINSWRQCPRVATPEDRARGILVGALRAARPPGAS